MTGLESAVMPERLIGMTYQDAWLMSGGAAAEIVNEGTETKLKSIVAQLGFNPNKKVRSIDDARLLFGLAGAYEPNVVFSDHDGNKFEANLFLDRPELPKFSERHPQVYRALRVAGIALSLFSLVGLPIMAGGAAAASPTIGQIQEKAYSDGKDLNSTLDDRIVFEISDGGNWYWIGVNSDPNAGINITKTNESMEIGAGIEFYYDKNSGSADSQENPYRVTQILKIMNESDYFKSKSRQDAAAKAKSDSDFKGFATFMGGAVGALISVMTISINGRRIERAYDNWKRNRQEIKAERQRQRRIKNK